MDKRYVQHHLPDTSVAEGAGMYDRFAEEYLTHTRDGAFNAWYDASR